MPCTVAFFLCMRAEEILLTYLMLELMICPQDVVVAERDYLKQELGMFIEQTESLEKEKAALSQELEEKRETDEFKCLEEEFRKEHEVTLFIWCHSDSKESTLNVAYWVGCLEIIF